MNIGEALKNEREKLGLSKYQFSKGIIDRKFYSKVENGEGCIGSEPLVRILFKYHIDIQEFWNLISDTYSDKNDLEIEKLNKKMELAVRMKDYEKIKQYSQAFYQIEGEDISYIRGLVFISYLEGKSISTGLLDKVEHLLDRHEDFSKDIQAMRLFSSSLPFLNDAQINYFMKIVLNKAEKRKLDRNDMKRIAQLCNNYLGICLKRGMRSAQVEEAYNFLNKLVDHEFLIYRILGRRDYYLINNEEQKAEKLTNVLKDFGYNL